MKISNEILNILEKCTVEDNTVFLTCGQLDRKMYTEVNKCLENIGGKWNRKAKGHVFDSDPVELLDNLILTGETVGLKKQYQYFPTPSSIAKMMVEMAEITDGDYILEPSAGQGAILDELPAGNLILSIELNAENAKILRLKGYDALEQDFLQFNEMKFDRIVMNPPFSRQQDIDHIIHAYELLKDGGVLVSVVSEGPFFRENKKSVEFRKILENNNAEIIDIDQGSFKESGTMVKTRIIKIHK
jgi:phospholipid N-methyltransferase